MFFSHIIFRKKFDTVDDGALKCNFQSQWLVWNTLVHCTWKKNTLCGILGRLPDR